MKGRRRSLNVCGTACLLWWCAMAAGHAQERAHREGGRAVHSSDSAVRFPGCAPALASEVASLLTIELGETIERIHGREAQVSFATELRVECTPSNIRLRVTVNGVAFPTERAMPHRDIARRALARTVAISAAELVRAARAADQPSAPANAPSEPEAAPIPEPPPPSPHSWALGIEASGRFVLGRFDTFGGRIGVTKEWGVLRAALMLGSEYGATSTSLGDVRGLGAHVVPRVSLRVPQRGTVAFSAGIAAYIGMAMLSGTSDMSSVQTDKLAGVWFAPAARAELIFEPWKKFGFLIGIEAGHPVVGVQGRVDGTNESTWSRSFLSASVGSYVRL